ncbi:MAG: hypothetical protein U0930_17125 [Pirellulales bacterium]
MRSKDLTAAILGLAVFVGLSLVAWQVVLGDDGQPNGKVATTQLGTQSADNEVEVKQLVDQLGATSYAQRREAYNKLLLLGTAATEQIERAANSSDRQIAESARRLKILLKVLSHCQDKQVAMEVSDLFLSPSEENLGELTERGLWQLADLFLTEHEALVTRSQESFYQDLSTWYLIQQIIDDAQRQGDVKLAWPIVARLAPIEVVCWTAQKLNLPLPELPDDDHHRAQQLFYSGEISKALALNVSPVLKYRFCVQGFQWQLLEDKQLQQVLVGGIDNAGTKSAKALRFEFAGNVTAANTMWSESLGIPLEKFVGDGSPASKYSKEVYEAALKQLKDASPIVDRKELDKRQGLAQKPAAFYQLAISLLLSGRSEPLKEYLLEEDPQAAFGFLAQDDYAQAFKAIGLEPDLSNFDQEWLPKQVRETGLSLKSLQRNQDVEQDLMTYGVNLGQAGSILSGLGHREQAKKIMQEMFRLARDFKGTFDFWNRCVLRYIGSDNWRDLCFEVTAEQFEQIRNEHRVKILEKLFPHLGTNATLFLQESPAVRDNVANKWAKALEQLNHLERCDKDYFGTGGSAIVRAWMHRVANQKVKATGNKNNFEDEMSFSETSRKLELAKLAYEWDDVNTAIELLGIYGPNAVTEFEHYLLAARICLKNKHAATALEFMEANDAGPRELHWRSLVRMEALLASGKIEQAEQELLARWMRLNGLNWNSDRTAGHRIVEDFMKEERWEDALEYAERNFMVERQSNYYSYWQGRQYANILEELEQFEKCANVYRGLLVELLRPNSQIVRLLGMTNDLFIFRISASKERSARAAAEIAKGNFEAARRELDVGFRLHSVDVEPMVQCYPMLMKAGQETLAQEFFAQFESALMKQIATWPNDAMTLNNLAWMYAKCDVKLDEALVLSKKAVDLVPSSATYRDTLAEIYFHHGNVDEAIETMRGCVKIDPREQGYRKNLVRFSAARK